MNDLTSSVLNKLQTARDRVRALLDTPTLRGRPHLADIACAALEAIDSAEREIRGHEERGSPYRAQDH